MTTTLRKRLKIRKQRMGSFNRAGLNPHSFYRQNGGKTKEQMREAGAQAIKEKKPTPCPAGLAASERRFRDICKKTKTKK